MPSWYGGIVSAGFYDNVSYPSEGQEASDRYVSWAVERGVNYFDVAPGYGNAQDQLGIPLSLPETSKVSALQLNTLTAVTENRTGNCWKRSWKLSEGRNSSFSDTHVLLFDERSTA